MKIEFLDPKLVEGKIMIVKSDPHHINQEYLKHIRKIGIDELKCSKVFFFPDDIEIGLVEKDIFDEAGEDFMKKLQEL